MVVHSQMEVDQARHRIPSGFKKIMIFSQAICWRARTVTLSPVLIRTSRLCLRVLSGNRTRNPLWRLPCNNNAHGTTMQSFNLRGPSNPDTPNSNIKIPSFILTVLVNGTSPRMPLKPSIDTPSVETAQTLQSSHVYAHFEFL
jgi:hypothetical protein